MTGERGREAWHTLLTSARFKTQSATSCGCFFKGEAIVINQKAARTPLASAAVRRPGRGLLRLRSLSQNEGQADRLNLLLKLLLLPLFFNGGSRSWAEVQGGERGDEGGQSVCA